MSVAPAFRAGTRRPSLRTVAAWAFAIGVVAAAILIVRIAGGAGAFLGVDQLVAGPAAALASVSGILPLGYAFAAGMLAAVNPCGFALLPAYLGLYLGSDDGSASPVGRLTRAVGVSATMSGTFVLAFGAAGLLLAAIGSAFGSALPAVGLLVGLGLAGAGAYLLSGGTVYSSLADRAAARLSGAARSPGYRGYAAYGLAYAAASLGCTLPIFLTVVGLATAAHDPARSAGQFALYGLGMGFVVTILTVATALFKGAVLARARIAGSRLSKGTGVLLVVTGAYITAYWLALGF